MSHIELFVQDTFPPKVVALYISPSRRLEPGERTLSLQGIERTRYSRLNVSEFRKTGSRTVLNAFHEGSHGLGKAPICGRPRGEVPARRPQQIICVAFSWVYGLLRGEVAP